MTGVLYIALDSFPGTPVVLRGLDPSVPELPTVPTELEKWTAKLEKMSDAIAALPLQELAHSLIDTVDEARRLLKSPEVASSLKNLDAALAGAPGLVRKVDTLATNVNVQIGPLSTEAQATLKSAQSVLGKLDAHADPLLASLEKTSNTAGVTLERAQATLAGVDGTLNQDSALGSDLGMTLRDLREAARSVGSLADYLERNPNALLFGSRRPAQGVR